ncbi:MAG: hypothetical protein J6Q41_07425 [Firmicutes bacterium]|nr:hypothetical protein [Bacillota bacterium]
MKKIFIVLLSVITVFAFMLTPISQDVAYASSNGTCDVIQGYNDGANDYWRWSEPVRSYLIKEGSQLMRVQANAKEEGVFQVTYYDPSTYEAVSRKRIYTTLPIFGGFATDGTYYYVVTGQNNPNESDSVEVFRIQKYDKNWKSLGYQGLYGANTYIPFDAGSCRFAFSGNYMVVRTSHEMYYTNAHHQANVTILYDKANNVIKDKQVEIANYKTGYVSHSFNQFVQINDGKIVALDHGDAGETRALVMLEYPNAVSTGTLPNLSTANKTPVTKTNVLSFAGSSGNNDTGCSVGAFEMNDYNYFAAYNTVTQDSNFDTYRTRNVYVAAIDKSTKSIKRLQFTNYAEGNGSTSTPHLVNIGGAYLVLWNEGNLVYCNKITAKGVKVNDANTLLGYGYLSDCVPYYDSANYKVIWYYYSDDREKFFEIDLNSMTLKEFEHTYTHNYKYDSTSNGLAIMKCSDCGSTYNVATITDFKTEWRLSSMYYYDDVAPEYLTTGTNVKYSINNKKYADSSLQRNEEIEIVADDTVNCHIDKTNKNVVFDKAGTYVITIYPKLNPSFKKTYTFNVKKGISKVTLTASKTTVKPGDTVTLTAKATGGIQPLYSFWYTNYSGYNILIAHGDGTSDYNNVYKWKPQTTGTYKVYAEAQDDYGNSSEAKSSYVTITVQNSSDSSSSGISLEKYAAIAKITNKIYTGKKIKPEPKVEAFGITLVKNRDYMVS